MNCDDNGLELLYFQSVVSSIGQLGESNGFEVSVMFVCRVQFRLSQDPNSENLGTTVWDASIVLAKYLEKVCSPLVMSDL